MNIEELRELKKRLDMNLVSAPPDTHYVNNHIHTTYSFSPYTPTDAVYTAWKNGLKTAGIMDHDSVGGAKEFIEAGAAICMPITVGMECRVDMAATSLVGRRLNNPDQISIAYVAMHGIPHQNIDRVNDFIAPYREKRNIRNRKMCEKITDIMAPYSVSLDFDTDVLPLSNYSKGGSVTERHILFALTEKITKEYDTPEKVIEFLKNKMNIKLSSKNEELIAAGQSTPGLYKYDILGALKSNLVEKFYIDATDECPAVDDFIKMVHDNGGIAAYAYLGDVGQSVTGDKKAQKFEDDYLDELFEVLYTLNFDAVTYMPTRNTLEQLNRIMKLCDKYGFFQISGEDINSPRQSFICKALDDNNFKHLIDATYTLIDYENAASVDLASAREKFAFIFDKR